jgi:hypothetical protein
MNNKCKNCFFENDVDSIFCQECGYSMDAEKISLKNIDKSPKHKHLDIDDVIFQPREKNNNFITFLKFLIMIVVVGFILLVMIGVFSQTSTNQQNTQVTTHPTPDPQIESDSFPLSDLILQNLSTEWAEQGVLNIQGTLTNTNMRSAQNVNVRVDFYKDEDNTQLFDTRYITISGVSYRGAYSFSESVKINITRKFWYTLTIVSAEYYKP